MKKSSKMNQKRTFNEILADVRPSTRQRLWDQAITANQIAKISRGRARQAAYAEKAKNLQALVAQGQATVKIDEACEYEILSIELSGRRRLHAHVCEIQSSPLACIDPQQCERRGA